MSKRLKILNRFIDKIDVLNVETDCWEWIGAKCEKGYGRFNLFRENRRAHHVALWLFRGKSLDLYSPQVHTDHKCCNPSCVNPEHLRVVSATFNRRRQAAMQRRKRREEEKRVS